jgi:F-type H+-transporting ATPase subunit a
MSKNNISIASEKLSELNIFGLDFILTNTIFTTILVCSFLIIIALVAGYLIPKSNKPISQLQTFILMIGELFVGLILSMSSNKNPNGISNRKFALVCFFFSFILFSSWAGLLPGVGQLLLNNGQESVHLLRAPTTDLNATIALSLIAFVLIQLQGIKALKFGYLKKFINLSSPMKFFVGLLELVSEISRLLSFSLRLFGNFFAGETMIAIIASMSLGSVYGFSFGLPFPSFVIALEFCVAIIQSYVFVALFLVFSDLAKEPAH